MKDETYACRFNVNVMYLSLVDMSTLPLTIVTDTIMYNSRLVNFMSLVHQITLFYIFIF